MATPHKLVSESYQWGKVRGGRPGDAITWFRCVWCGKGFAHRYNIQPDIYQAAKDNGFDLDVCDGSPSYTGIWPRHDIDAAIVKGNTNA